jgi:drug/metabolite transporter (DMT)-like permease
MVGNMTKTQTIRAENTHTHIYIALLMGVISVSMAAIFIRLAQNNALPSLLIACARLLIAAAILTPAVLRNKNYLTQIRQLGGFERLLIFTSGAFLALHFAAWVTSLEYTTVLISVVLVTTTSIWVALLEVFFLKAKLSQMIITGLAIAMIGGLVIGLSGGDGDSNNGDPILGALLSVVGAITVAVYMIIGRKLRPHLSLAPYIWLVYGIAALILLAIIIITATPITGFKIEGYGWLLALGLIPQLIGHSSFNYALAYLPATYVSVATQLEPVLSAIIAYFVFSEIPGQWQVIGGVIIVAGVIVASLRPTATVDVPPQ